MKLSSAALSFIGGAARKYVSTKEGERKALAEEKKLLSEREHERQLQEDKLAAEAKAEEAQYAREQQQKQEERARRLKGVSAEWQQLQGQNTKKGYYIGLGGEYPELKSFDYGENYLTEEESIASAAKQNINLKDSGYMVIPRMTDDNRGWRTEIKEVKADAASDLFDNSADANKFADEQLAYYKKIGANMIPVFEQQDKGIAVKFIQPTKDTKVSSLYKTQEEAQQAATTGMQYYDNRPELKGKFVPKIEQTSDGWKVEFQQITGKKDGDGVAKDPVLDVPYDTNYLFARSKKLGGIELAQKKALNFDAISLTGNPVLRFGKEQANQIEDQDHLIIQKNGIGDTAGERVENHAAAIQRDLTPDNVNKIIANKDTPAGSRAYQTMISTFQNFINTYKNANRVTLTDRTFITPIEERHSWLAKYMDVDEGIRKVLSQDLAQAPTPGTPQASLIPANEPVVLTEEGITQYARPNLVQSPVFIKHEPSASDPNTMVPVYNDSFLATLDTFTKDSQLGQDTLLDILNTAVDPSTNEAGPTAAEEAFKGLQNAKNKLSNAGKFVTLEDGFVSYEIPPMSTTARVEVLSDINRFSDYNNRLIAVQAALPASAVKAANGQLRDGSAKGKYDAVTGGGMKYTVVDEQLGNAQEMENSINGLQEALVKDAATGQQGEVGFVLNVERLSSGVGYMFEALQRELTTDADVDRDGMFGNLNKRIQEAVSESDVEKKNNALVKLYGTMLSYQLARLMDPNGRLSDEDRRTIEDGIGLMGISANPEAILSLTQELRGRVDYIKARNEAYMSNNTKRILSAFLYDKLSGGGNFKKTFYQAFSVDPNNARGSTGQENQNPNAGLTVDPAFIRLMNAKQKTTQPAQTQEQTQQQPTAPVDIPVL